MLIRRDGVCRNRWLTIPAVSPWDLLVAILLTTAAFLLAMDRFDGVAEINQRHRHWRDVYGRTQQLLIRQSPLEEDGDPASHRYTEIQLDHENLPYKGWGYQSEARSSLG